MDQGYTLVIAEKPDAARRIARALGNPVKFEVARVEAHDVKDSFNGKHFVVCSAAGHLYGISDDLSSRSNYPVFETKWLPLNEICSRSRSKHHTKRFSFSVMAAKRISAIKALSVGARNYVHACDYDLEGETIGVNILKFACGQPSTKGCLRARFSTLTESDIRYSFSHLERIQEPLATAGELRHVVDFVWGINLSRALTGAYKLSGHGYRNLTAGRVQAPTLTFVVDREIAVKTHVPIPFWKIFASLSHNGTIIESQYEMTKIERKSDADRIMFDVSSSKEAHVESVKEFFFSESPPFPFNLSDLQAESYARFKIPPHVTLKIAQKLYLRALISYPRTGSQKLPESIGLQKIIYRISLIPGYKILAANVLRDGRKSPKQGLKDDLAHPAIHPTGEAPGELDSHESKIYDLIVRRFLAAFGDDARLSREVVRFKIASHIFESRSRRVLKEGWLSIMPPTFNQRQNVLPKFNEGDVLKVVSAALRSEFEKKPERYNQSTLLQEMDAIGIGTKSTRAEIIQTLISREYVQETSSRNLQPSEIGLRLVEALKKYCPEILSAQLTKKVESELEQISLGQGNKDEVLNETKLSVSSAVQKIKLSAFDLGVELSEAARESAKLLQKVGKCPSCQSGFLAIIRSHTTGKRFIGCSNFSNGCRASAPLPQRGTIKVQTRTCPSCKWPLVTVFKRAWTPWVMCPNMNCSSRKSS
ncbi:MAG TPA: DNA topoisomerase I [Nitrososphaerales archaeon]|nr:DNA topoisomerase I [Nitrososphaerales archaeon]